MGFIISLIALAALIVLAIIGAAVPALHVVFTVAAPYLAIAVFLFGIVYRILKWAKAPVPFRITTTCGQAKSHDWIKQNKFDCPSSTLGVIGRMALEVLFFRSLFRNTKADLKGGPHMTYTDNKWLWAFSLAFHYSFLIIFLRHFRFFTETELGFVGLIESLDSFMQIGVPLLYLTNIGIVAGLGYLLLRRIFDRRVRYITLMQDYFPLMLILTIAITGIVMRYFVKTDLIAIKDMAVGILSLSPVEPAATISAWFYVHFFLVCSLLVYFPMSKLMHMPGIFFSPTRNMANDNRMRRHVNPWNDDFKMHHHTYEEYEDDFRDLMKGVGLPLDKEPTGKENK